MDDLTQSLGEFSGRALPPTIGRYRVLSLLGEGGMGVVYEAEQQQPRRRVALKVVRGGQFVDERRVRLFEREAETLARLKHPRIGAIYESGRTDDGQHFFAMELVRGETLDRFLERRRDAAAPDELRIRLSLFRKVADAVHYAHQRGVIHRDLKPSNIIVSSESARVDDIEGATTSLPPTPEVKILDFGLARITDGDLATATTATEVGVLKGTVAYMAPEQARGATDEIDLRADVYALGVILYEMLSGTRPHDLGGRSLVEAVRIISEEPARPLRSVLGEARRLDADIETIVGKALQKESDRRYASAAALSEDVARYLTSQPILARPPSAVYQIRKFAARNRALVGGIAATFAVLVAGIVVSTVLGLREARQRKAAVAAQKDLATVVEFQSGMLRGVDPQRMGESLVDDLVRRVSAADGDARGRQFRASLAGVNATDAALHLLDEHVLDRAARSIGERFGQQPLIEARLRLSLGETYRELGLLERSETQVLRSRELRLSALGPDHLDTLAAGLSLSHVYERQGRLVEAETLAREVAETSRRVLGADHDLTLWSLNRLAIALDLQERFGEALQTYEQVYEARRRLLGDESRETIWLLHNIGSIHRRSGHAAEGIPLLEQAVAAFRRTLGDDHRDTLWAMESLGLAYREGGRLPEAERVFVETFDKRRRLLGDDHQETLSTADGLARVYRDQGRLDEAEALTRDTLEKGRRTLGEDNIHLSWPTQLLAEIAASRGNDREALTLYDGLVRTRSRSLGVDHPQTLLTRYAQGALHRKMGRLDAAEEILGSALAARLRSPASDPRNVRALHVELAFVKAQRRDPEAALDHLKEAMRLDPSDAARVLDDSALDVLRGEPEFAALVSSAKAQ